MGENFLTLYQKFCQHIVEDYKFDFFYLNTVNVSNL